MKSLPGWAWAVAVLFVVLLFNAAFTPGFFHVEIRDGRLFGSVVDIVNRSVPVALLSLGMTLVIATRGVDLSVGAVIAISGAVAAGIIARPADTPFAGGAPAVGSAVPMALAAALLCGLFNGVLVAVMRFQPIVATLLLMVAGRGVAQLLSNGQILTFSSPGFAGLARGAVLAVPNPVWILAATLVAFVLVTRATALGLFIEMTGSNPDAARLVGIHERGIKVLVYVLCALCAGIAGLILTADIQAADANNAGLYLELDAILAVAVGGTSLSGGRFSFAGSLIGAILMQALTTTILTRGVSPEITLVLKAAVVVAVCLLQAPTFKLRRIRRTA